MVMAMFASKDDAIARKAICDVCPKKLGMLCGECGCLVAAKVRLNAASCPLNKWGQVEPRLTQPYDIEEIPNNTAEPSCCGENNG